MNANSNSTPHAPQLLPLTLAAVGVVYGDIGTSPLYPAANWALLLAVTGLVLGFHTWSNGPGWRCGGKNCSPACSATPPARWISSASRTTGWWNWVRRWSCKPVPVFLALALSRKREGM
jgi:hypothetical protein